MRCNLHEGLCVAQGVMDECKCSCGNKKSAIQKICGDCSLLEQSCDICGETAIETGTWSPDKNFIDFVVSRLYHNGDEDRPFIESSGGIITKKDIVQELKDGTVHGRQTYNILLERVNRYLFQEWKDRN